MPICTPAICSSMPRAGWWRSISASWAGWIRPCAASWPEPLAGFLARDYERVAQLHYDVGFVPPHHPMETFAQALRAIGEPIFGRPRA